MDCGRAVFSTRTLGASMSDDGSAFGGRVRLLRSAD